MKSVFFVLITTFFCQHLYASNILEINPQIRLNVIEVEDRNNPDHFYILDQDFQFQNQTLKLNIPRGTCVRKSSGFYPMRRGDPALAPTGSFSFHQHFKSDCQVNISSAEELNEAVQVNIDGVWKKAYVHFDRNMNVVAAAIKEDSAFLMKVSPVQGVEFINEFQHVDAFSLDTSKGTKYYQFYNRDAGISYNQELTQVYNQEAHIYSIHYQRNFASNKYEAIHFESGSVLDLPLQGGGTIVFVGWESDRFGECEYEFSENLVVSNYQGVNCIVIKEP